MKQRAVLQFGVAGVCRRHRRNKGRAGGLDCALDGGVDQAARLETLDGTGGGDARTRKIKNLETFQHDAGRAGDLAGRSRGTEQFADIIAVVLDGNRCEC